MQFFPASMSNGAQPFRANSAFEMMDSRPGQDFSDLLSAHLDQPDAAPAPPQTEQPQSSCGHEQPFVDDRDFSHKRMDDSAADSTGYEQESAAVDAEAVQGGGTDAVDGGVETAKAAVSGQESSDSGQGGIATVRATEGRDHDGDGRSAEQASDSSADSLADEAQAVLDGLADDAEGLGGGQGDEGIKARIEALHELLRQFRESDPAGRSELAVTLGAQIKALKAEFAAAAETRAVSSAESGRTVRNAVQTSAQATSRATQRLEALAQRFEAYRNQEKSRESHGRGQAQAGSALADKASAASGDDGVRSRLTNASAVAVAASQRADSAHLAGEGKGASESAVASVKKSDKGSDTAMRSASRGKEASNAAHGQPDGPSGVAEDAARKTRVASEAAEESLLQGDRRQESAASGADQKNASPKEAERAGRGESATARAGLVAAGNRTSAARDGSEQAVLQDAGSQAHEGDSAKSRRVLSADSEGQKKQNDARQGFFGASDREKTSSSTLRATQSAGVEKGASESLTQTAVQNSQTQFQQRLESSVSTRSAQVYQQVENGAFKNLGQGIKQLVIRLDPADLGQVSVVLQVRGKEVQAVLRSSNQETSLALNEQLGQLRTQLEAQGLKVGKLEVQTQLADSQDQSQWQGAENHNRYQENQELAMSAKRWRTLERVVPDLAREVQNSPQREKLSQSGLDIFA